MKTHFFLLFVALGVANVASTQKPEVIPYIDFLKTQHTDPVEYVFRLFEKYDIVILGERDHRDTTQYELVQKILSDPRFIENVGNVFTEVGVSNRTEWANRVVKGSYKSQADFEAELRKLYREVDWQILCSHYDLWKYLNDVYRINKNLPESKKISVYFTDVSYDWSQCTSVEQRKKEFGLIYWRGSIRDSIMGRNFIEDYSRILLDTKDKRKKALVIFNRPHSYQRYLRRWKDFYVDGAASYIFEAYPGRVANVMINWVSFHKSGREYLIADGKWDAAFRYAGNPSVGFDLAGTPFGADSFDHYDPPVEGVKWQNIYTGFIFYKPIEEWVTIMGFPSASGVIDEAFIPEFKRRIFLDNDSTWTFDDFMKYYTLRIMPHWEKNTPKDSVDVYINSWLK
jgi:hypothetical protein